MISLILIGYCIISYIFLGIVIYKNGESITYADLMLLLLAPVIFPVLLLIFAKYVFGRDNARI